MGSFLDDPLGYYDKKDSEVTSAAKPSETKASPAVTPAPETKPSEGFLSNPLAYYDSKDAEVHAASQQAEKPEGDKGDQAIHRVVEKIASYAPWRKKETPSETQDSADVLVSSVKDKSPEEAMALSQDALQQLSPDQLKKVRDTLPWLPLPTNLWEKTYEHERSQPVSLPTREDLASAGEGVKATAENLAKGVYHVGRDLFDLDKEKLANDVKSYVSPIFEAPAEVGWTAAKVANGGTRISDRVAEMFGQSPDTSKNHAYQRYLVDLARAQAEKASKNNVYSFYATSPTFIAGIKAKLRLSSPDADDATLQQQAEQIAQGVADDQKPLDEAVKTLGQFTLPHGTGMGEFGVAMGAVPFLKGAAAAAESVLPAAVRQARIAAKQQANLAKLGKEVEAAGKVSALGRMSGRTADLLDNLQEASEKFSEAHPVLSGIGSFATKYAPGAIVGYEADSEHPYLGALLGAGIERTALGGLAKMKAGEALAKLPRVVSDVEETRALSAGGRVGAFQGAGIRPESSELTQKLFGGDRGAKIDRIGQYLSDYGREGVNMTALGLATGAINSDNSDQMRDLVENGLIYGFLGKTVQKALHADPVDAARKAHQQDVDNHKMVSSLSPETQANLRAFTNWDPVVAQAQAYLDHVRATGGDVAGAEKNLRLAQNANLHTREAYRREVLNSLTTAHNLINGQLRAGQPNIAIEVLSGKQIFDRLAAQNPNKAAAELQAIADSSKGVYFPTGAREITPGEAIPEALKASGTDLNFNPLKPTVVVNMDRVIGFSHSQGKSLNEAMSHELGHAIQDIPEFRDLNKDVYHKLFDTEFRGPDGKVYHSTKGLYSDKELVKMFFDNYLSNDEFSSKADKEAWAASRGFMRDGKPDEAKIADYMKDEVMADLNGTAFHLKRVDKLDSGRQHILDWAAIEQQNNLLARAVHRLMGNGGDGKLGNEPKTFTGAKFSPEIYAAHRDAIRAMQKLNGMVSTPARGAVAKAAVSRAQLLKSKALLERYGKDSGLFKTEFRATIFDKDGNVVGHTVLSDPLTKEGTWGEESGQLTQRSGYGELPKELGSAAVPPGGTVKVSREIVMGPDGETPQMLTAKEAKDLAATRDQLIRNAIDGTDDVGTPGRFQPFSADGLSYSGTFTPKQIEAIRSLPESVVPAKIKDTILRFNKLIDEGQGTRMLIDYAARLDERGKYKAFSPKIYDVVPIGMGFSKAGNFYITAISVTRLLNKLELWADRMPSRLDLWGRDREAFFRDFADKYLPNHLAGKPGETGLDKNPEVAIQKKNIFNDFLNLTRNDAVMNNPDRTTVPRKKGDPRGSDSDRTIMAIRADAVADILESTATPLPVDYGKQLANFLPSGERAQFSEGAVPQTPQEPIKEETNPILRAMAAAGRTPYAQTTKSANPDVQNVARQYVEGLSMEYRPHGKVVPVDEDLAKRIADFYQEAKETPGSPDVKKAYSALVTETVAQWKAFEKAGYTATPWTKKGQPYANSAEMMKDVRDNKHLYYFQTEQGFGEKGITPEMRESTPMLQPSGVDFGEAKNVPVNDVFRVVHDIVGHGAHGYEFGPKGEFNAYLEHSRMYSDEAKPALAVDTLAQNSWVNYGPHLRNREGNIPRKGEEGYVAPPDRPFADQKILTIPRNLLNEVDKYAEEQRGPSFLPAGEPKKKDFKTFFSDVTKGTFGKSDKPFFPELDLGRKFYPIIQSKQNHSGNFDDHIAKSIPTFYETQIATLHALGKALPKGSRVLDVAAGEGSYGKALTETSGGNVHTVSLEPNPDMARFFESKSQVPGAEYSTDAFGSGWTEADGTVVNKFEPKEKFDAVHESMGFQFISPDRESQVAEVKRLLKPDGIFLTEEKVTNPDWAANEKLKDTQHKNKYFTPEELAAKDRKVGFSGKAFAQSASESKSTGMMDNQVEQGQLESILSKNFAHVAQYWDAGNFKGYVASDSPEALQRFLDNVPNLKSKFSTTETPRMVTGEKPVDSQAQKPVNQEINQPIATDATQQTPQYLPSKGAAPEVYPQAQGAKPEDSQAGERERIRFHSGLAAVSRAAQGAGAEGVQGASGAASRKEVEAKALLEHAEEAGLLTDPDAFFKQWKYWGSEAGGEHQVLFPFTPGSNEVLKRTPNPNYPTWADYYDSLNVHNALFPKAALTARGLQNVEGSGGVDIDGHKWPAGLYSEVSQPFLEISRGLSGPETDELMKTRGFYRVRAMEYYNPELKIHMTDLHGMNAVMLRDQNGKEFPYVIDSYIRPTGEKDAADVKRIEDQVGTQSGPSFLPAGKVESPEFKKWFGDSQVVDEEGKPRVMYHGTGTGFTKFGKGGYFAFDPELADKFANRAASGFMAESEYAYNPKNPDEEQAEGFSMTPVIMPVYLKADNIFDANNPEHMRKIGKAPDSFGDYQQIENNQDRIKKAGFDGYYDHEYGTDRDKTGVFVYDPTQVKSATGNVGTYSPESADIRYLPAKKGDIPVQHPSKEKEGSVGGDLDLVHFGAYGVSTADPKKMGKGSATSIDRSGLPKTYFYINGTKYEEGIQEQTPYLAKVDGNSIYDLDADPLGLKQTNREKMDKAIQDAGFAGYMSRKKPGQNFDAVAMFKKTKLAEALPTDVFSKKEAKRRMEAGGPEIDYAAQDEAFQGPSYLAAKPGITAAAELAKENVDELKSKLDAADDDFFTKLWPSLLKKTGLNLKASSQNLGRAASIAVNDVVDWLKENQKYQDYYHTDRETTKQLLKQEYPDMTDDDFEGFMMFMGLTSPSTKLKGNVAEALRVFNLWKNEGSVKSLSLIKTPKGNVGVGPGPFKLIGPTAANKLRTLHYMEDLHNKLGSWEKVSKHLQEPVTMKELNAFNRELGYSGGIGKAGEVKQVVKEATGQDELIPRMFVFGPKVGAYTMNHVGDDRYTTTDIWEGRFVRSHFPEMFKKGTGLPTNVSEHKIFQTFSSKFNEVFKEKTGLDLSPAALQAARWFFMIAKANEAGYKHAKTNGTISEYTEEALRNLRSGAPDADWEGSNQEDTDGTE